MKSYDLINWKIIIFFIFLAVFHCRPVFSNGYLRSGTALPCVTRFEHGSVNWSTGNVMAQGRAELSGKNETELPNALLRAARADAVANLTYILKQLPLRTGITIEDAFNDEIIFAGIEDAALNAEVIHHHYISDLAMEVTLRIEMFGGFLQLVLPREIKQIPSIHLLEPERKMQWEERCTGLVIDAVDIGFQPVLFPVVKGENGREIYSDMFVSREYAVQHGVCLYACGHDPAAIVKRVGFNPLVIKGLRKGGTGNAYIVISAADAEKIESLTERHLFMKECRVVIFLAP